MLSDIVYKIGFGMTPGITADVVHALAARGISNADFFEMQMSALSELTGGTARLQNLDRQEALFKARKEAEFVKKHNIKVLFLLDDDYPVLLREVPDAPVVLYVLGNADLNATPSLAMVGTRRCTAYGTSFCSSFISDIASYYNSAVIYSGLAYGIDAASHIAALENRLRTVAVVAHGLDTIYPAPHRDLARRIIAAGGAIISEYPSGTRPFQKNFLERNRIVAGLSELTFVIESEIKGGAMSTANQAFSYNREVYALPGRYTDTTSSGTNMLIAREKARIFTSVADLMTQMQWPIPALNGAKPPQRSLFPELQGDHLRIYDFLRKTKMPASIDEIHVNTRLSMPVLMAALTELEFDGVINKLPGARYEAI